MVLNYCVQAGIPYTSGPWTDISVSEKKVKTETRNFFFFFFSFLQGALEVS